MSMEPSSPDRAPGGAFFARLDPSRRAAHRLADRWLAPSGPEAHEDDGASIETEVSALDHERLVLGAMGPLGRAAMLHGVAGSLRAERHDFALLIAREAGKPLSLALAEVDRAASTFDLAAEEALREDGTTMALERVAAHARLRGEVRRVARGPVLAITPFNFPLNLVAHKVAPALAVGVPVLVKPSPHTPISAHALAALVAEHAAGARPMRVVEASIAHTLALVDDRRLPVVSFTGSAPVGWSLKARAPKKRVLLELGGTAPAIIDDDVAITDALATHLAASAFAYAGQVCISLQRVITLPKTHAAVVDALTAAARLLRVEDPVTATSILGPLITPSAAARVEQLTSDARDHGVRFSLQATRDGSRLGPSIAVVARDQHALPLVADEAFGPVLCVQSASSWEDAIAIANEGPFGLQASVFTDRFAHVRDAFARLDFGGVLVNEAPTLRSDAQPYGGMRESGDGREGVRFAMTDFTDSKILLWREPSA
jgi:acyl-CoA reductase-like NAD-dependent aldehyde dehydrogenase